MAISGLGFGCRGHIPLRCPPYMYCARKVRPSCVTAIETLSEPEGFFNKENHESHKQANGDVKVLKWKKLNAKDLGITSSMISKPTNYVLKELNRKGYEVYLVGGCVRDLILKQTPKDFDIITSAELKQVLRTFSRSEVVGRRFPICHVHVDDTIVEVSSFSTSARKSRMESRNITRPRGCNEHDYLRWRNCMGRDFTINGFMYDPFANVVYDYIGGMEDLKKAKVRTVIPPDTSFQEDCARILRAVRIAARLGFRFTKDTALSVKNLSCLVSRLDKGRLLMEMNYMLAYGSAEASLRLLWRFGLLEILLPIQAAYFVSQGFRRRDKRSNMLLSLFANLDGCLAPDRPCHCSLWAAILVFHKALVDHPKDHMVVATFSLTVHLGGDLLQAVSIARTISRPHDNRLCELLEPREWDSDETIIEEVLDLAASVKAALKMMTSESFVAEAMAKYPNAPYSDLVLIPLQQYLRVLRIFDCVRGGKEKGFTPKRGMKIDYEYLGMGNLQEVRHIFARVVFDTIYPPDLNQRQDALHCFWKKILEEPQNNMSVSSLSQMIKPSEPLPPVKSKEWDVLIRLCFNRKNKTLGSVFRKKSVLSLLEKNYKTLQALENFQIGLSEEIDEAAIAISTLGNSGEDLSMEIEDGRDDAMEVEDDEASEVESDFKGKVLGVLKQGDFEAKRSSKLSEGDFLYLLSLFNQAGIHFS